MLSLIPVWSWVLAYFIVGFSIAYIALMLEKDPSTFWSLVAFWPLVGVVMLVALLLELPQKLLDKFGANDD